MATGTTSWAPEDPWSPDKAWDAETTPGIGWTGALSSRDRGNPGEFLWTETHVGITPTAVGNLLVVALSLKGTTDPPPVVQITASDGTELAPLVAGGYVHLFAGAAKTAGAPVQVTATWDVTCNPGIIVTEYTRAAATPGATASVGDGNSKGQTATLTTTADRSWVLFGTASVYGDLYLVPEGARRRSIRDTDGRSGWRMVGTLNDTDGEVGPAGTAVTFGWVIDSYSDQSLAGVELVPAVDAAPAPPTDTDPVAGMEGMVGRWRASDLALADGDPIASWPDISGAGGTFTQASASQRPTYIADGINGQPGALFDGVDDTLTAAWPSTLDEAAGMTIAVITRVVTPPSGGSAYGRFFTAAGDAYGLSCSGTKKSYAFSRNPVVSTGDAEGPEGWSSKPSDVLWFVHDGASKVLHNKRAGLEIGSVPNSGLSSSGASWSMGAADSSGSMPANAVIVEAIAWNRTLDAAEQAAVDSYAQDRYGIPVGDYVSGGDAPNVYDLLLSSSAPASASAAALVTVGRSTAAAAPVSVSARHHGAEGRAAVDAAVAAATAAAGVSAGRGAAGAAPASVAGRGRVGLGRAAAESADAYAEGRLSRSTSRAVPVAAPAATAAGTRVVGRGRQWEDWAAARDRVRGFGTILRGLRDQAAADGTSPWFDPAKRSPVAAVGRLKVAARGGRLRHKQIAGGKVRGRR